MFTLPYFQHAQYLSPVPLLPISGAWGPFAKKRGSRGGPRGGHIPAPEVVTCACAILVLFLVCVVYFQGLSFGVSSHPSARVDYGSSAADLSVGVGNRGRRRLQQVLAPVWYTLPVLFDAIYNLVGPWSLFNALSREHQTNNLALHVVRACSTPLELPGD